MAKKRQATAKIKKSKSAKRAAQARKPKGMRKAKRATRAKAKKRALKRAAPPQPAPAPPTLGGMTEDQ